MLESVHRIRCVITALGKLEVDPRSRELSPMLDLHLDESAADAPLHATA